MKAVATATINKIRLFLNNELLPTDIPERAKIFRDASDAQITCANENAQEAWLGVKFHAAYMLHNGTIVEDIQ